MRLTGLASGMDTESMIKDLMRVERLKVDRVSQQKKIAEWRQETYNNLNKDLANFILKSKEDLGLMTKSTSGGIQNSSYKNATWVKETSSSNESQLTATATGDSMNGVHTIDVKELAKGVSKVSTGGITTGSSKDSILNQFDSAGFTADDIMEFTISGENGDVTFVIGNNSADENANKDLETDGVNNIVRINKSLSEISLNEIVSKINTASVDQTLSGRGSSTKSLGIQAAYDEGLDKFLIKTKGVGENATLGIGSSDGNGKKFIEALKLGVNPDQVPVKSLNIEEGKTYKSVNTGATISVESSYEGTKTALDIVGVKEEDFTDFSINVNGNKIDITKTTTVDDIINGMGDLSVGITITSSSVEGEEAMSKAFIKGLNLTVSTDNAEGLSQDGVAVKKNNLQNGTNAVIGSYKVDGVEFLSKDENEILIPVGYNSNSFTINGVNFEAKATGVSSVTVNTNTESIMDKIKEFVDGYNEIVDKMNSLVSEKEYRDFKPLSDEEREGMSDKEIELWEEKAKSGLLKGDRILSNSIQKVRSGLYGLVEGVTGSYSHITDIGITTEKYVSGSMGGKLTIDEDKLREKIQDDAGGVMDLLFKQPTGDLLKDDSSLSQEQLKEKRAQSGVITRIFDNLASGMKDIVDKSGLGDSGDIIRRVRGKITSDFVIKGSKSSIDNKINGFNDRIKDLEKYLQNKEESYYRQFSAMEQALHKANSQADWLMQQFGGGM